MKCSMKDKFIYEYRYPADEALYTAGNELAITYNHVRLNSYNGYITDSKTISDRQ